MADFVFVSSVMNAGKTSRLLDLDFNNRRIGKKTLLMKPALDTRETKIKSRNGLEADCTIIHSQEDLLNISDVDIVFIDEAQFLTVEDIDFLRQLTIDTDISVYCFGLKSDFKGELFPASKRLLEVVDHIDEIKTMCLCGKKATMNIKYDSVSGKIIKSGETIECGYEDRYMSACYKHWNADNISEFQLS